MKSGKRIFPRPIYSKQMTKMVICSFPFRVTVGICGRLTVQQRRAIALTIYRDLFPKFQEVGLSLISHMGSIDNNRRIGAGFSPRQAPTIADPAGKLGFVVRIARLSKGMTQGELAQLIGIHRIHLGRIERGWVYPHVDNIARLERELGLDLTPYRRLSAAGAPKAAG